MWKYYTVSSIISNEMYIGNMVQGKYENKSYKSTKSSPVPKERWIRVEGTHEPIIEKELWDRVQEMRESRAKPMCTGELGLFAKKTRCMYCGYTLHSARTRGFRYLLCPQRKVGADCKGAFIAQRFLEQVIIDEINKNIKTYLDEDSAESHIRIKNETEDKKNILKKELQEVRMESDSLKKAIRDLYLDKAKAIISEEEFLFLKAGFDEELGQKERRELDLTEKLEHLRNLANSNKNKRDILEKYKNIKSLDRVMIDNLIDYIEIGRAEQKVHKYDLPPINIYWKF